jgi:hypothetical protein
VEVRTRVERENDLGHRAAFCGAME